MEEYPQQPPLSERIEASMEAIATVNGFTTFGECYHYIKDNSPTENGVTYLDRTAYHLAMERAKQLVNEIVPNANGFIQWLGLSFLINNDAERQAFQTLGILAWGNRVTIYLQKQWGEALDALAANTQNAVALRERMQIEGNAIINAITIVNNPSY